MGAEWGAVIGVLGALAGVALGKVWDERTEARRWERERQRDHEQWLRERRADAYARFTSQANRTPWTVDEGLDELLELMGALAAVSIYGSRELAKLAEKVEAAAVGCLASDAREDREIRNDRRDQTEKLTDELVAAIRKELRIAD